MDEKKIIKNLEDFFAKAPHLSSNWRERLVRVAPWFALIFGILGVMASIAIFGLSSAATVGNAQSGYYVVVTALSGIISSVLLLVAFSKLRTREYQGWRFLLLSYTVSILSSVLTLDLVGAVLGFVIGFYFLFEIKSYYK